MPLPSGSLLYGWIDGALNAMRSNIEDGDSSTGPPPPPPLPSPLPSHPSSSSSSPVPPADLSPSFSPADVPGPVKVCLPPSSASLLSFYSAVPQRAFDLQSNFMCQASTLSRSAALKDSQENGEAVRAALLKSIAAKEASKWKTVYPSSPLHTLSDPHYRIAARLNLGLPPHRAVFSHKCSSCNSPTALLNDRWHHLSCIAHRRRELTHRHDAVLNVLYTYVRAAGGVAVKEPAGLSAKDGKRPDLQIIFPSRHIISDVVISHPLAPSYLSKAKPDNESATVAAAARFKVNKYDEVSTTQHASFLPFAAESTGGLSSGAV